MRRTNNNAKILSSHRMTHPTFKSGVFIYNYFMSYRKLIVGLVIGEILILMVAWYTSNRLKSEIPSRNLQPMNTPVSPVRIDEEKARELVSSRPEVRQWLKISRKIAKPVVDVEDGGGGKWRVHLYDSFPDHVATFDWYSVDQTIGEVALWEQP